jgi:hypothetical protein
MARPVSNQIFLASLQNALIALTKSCNLRIDPDDFRKLDHHQNQLQSLFKHSNVKTQKFTKMMSQITRPTDMAPTSIFEEIDAFHYVLQTFKQKFSSVSFYGDSTHIVAFVKCVNSIFIKTFNIKALNDKLDDLYLWKTEKQDKVYFEVLDEEKKKIKSDLRNTIRNKMTGGM